MSDKRDQARSRWMQMFENIYPKYESLFGYGTELVVVDAETLKTYGEDGKEYTLQVAPWEVEDQLAGKLNNPDDSLLTEDSEGVKEQESKLESDIISRQAATSIPVLPKEERKKFKDYDDAFETGWFEALACVNMLPPVEPEQPRGEWVEVEKSEHGGLSIVSMRCNQCGRYAYLVLPKGTKCVYDYCPWCKADCRGEE